MYAGTNCGSVLSAVSTVLEPVRWKSSSVTETIGLAESKSGRAIREPVTITCSSSASWADVPPVKQAAVTRAMEVDEAYGGRAVGLRASGMMGSNQDFATNALRAKCPPKPPPSCALVRPKGTAQTSFAVSFRRFIRWKLKDLPPIRLNPSDTPHLRDAPSAWL